MTIKHSQDIAVLIADPGNKSDLTTLTTSLFFRQSLISDIMQCPRMAAFRNLGLGTMGGEFGIDTESNSPAALLGSAGHDVMEAIHRSDHLNYDLMELDTMFVEAFYSRVNDLSTPPTPSPSYASIDEELEIKSLDYASFIHGYQAFTRNAPDTFIPTMFEQQFVMQVEYLGDEYLIYGTLDQAGVYRPSNQFALRDVKFRVQAFKPNKFSLHFNPQLYIYAAALKYGVPACNNCKPTYEVDPVSMTKKAMYSGPCDECKAKIKTPKWPQRFPDVCQLVWMRDFDVYKKKYRGKPAGSFKGQGLYTTKYRPSRIHHYMRDAMSWCKLFTSGFAPRNPGSHCFGFCNFADECRAELYGSSTDT